MQQKLEPATLTRLLQLRSTFNHISQVSFAFSQINKAYPLEHIDEEQAQKVIKAYEELIEQTRIWALKQL